MRGTEIKRKIIQKKSSVGAKLKYLKLIFFENNRKGKVRTLLYFFYFTHLLLPSLRSMSLIIYIFN